MSTVEVVRERFRVALLDHERSVLLNILAAELERMTLGELGEVLTSDLGQAVRELSALALLDLVVARQRNTQPVPTVHFVDIPPPESQPADDASRRRANGRVGSAEEIAILRSEGVLKRSGHGRGTRYSVVSVTPPSSRPPEVTSSSGVIRRRRGELPSRDES